MTQEKIKGKDVDGKVLEISRFDDAVSALRELFLTDARKIQTVDAFTARWTDWGEDGNWDTEYMSDIQTPGKIIRAAIEGNVKNLIRVCNESIVIARASDTHLRYFKPMIWHSGIVFGGKAVRMFDDEMIERINGSGEETTRKMYVVLNHETHSMKHSS